MNVNGSKFHLVHDRDDWRRWRLPAEDVTLGELFDLDEAHPGATVEWNRREGTIRLARQLVQFRSAGEQPPTDLANRRGAGRDRYGHWYWISEEENAIRFLAKDETESVRFWSSTTADDCPPGVPLPGSFAPVEEESPAAMLLRGLAVTAGHYLVVGVVDQGLLIFDLHRGGPPLLLLWNSPEGERFAPWDMAATPDGGLLILSQEGPRYWRLDRNFRLATTTPAPDDQPPETTFQPDDRPADAPPRRERRLPPLAGYELPGGDEHGSPADPISIESGPGGSALVLNAPADGPSAVYEYVNGELRTVYELTYSVSDPDAGAQEKELQAHDMAYLELTIGEDRGLPLQVVEQTEKGERLYLLFVARRDGNQVVLYRLEPEEMDVDAQPDYLPLRRWQEKGLVAAGGQVHYDFGGRWIGLGVFLDCEYATSSVIQSPVDFQRRYRPGSSADPANLVNGLPEQPFDSNIEGCEWHRLFLDAEIPAGTQVLVAARAADEAGGLEMAPWQAQPRPYLRGGGAELPYYDPFADADASTLGERGGTWELLLQGIRGRYVQLQLTLLGTGRATPEIRSLRIWYPRFSYQDEYLPAVYGEDPVSASLTERLLANFEGLYTDIEEHIVHAYRLFDPRTVPAEAMEWLAGWMGVVLHPLWDEERRRFFIRFAHRLYPMRGTVPGLIVALRIFLDQEVDESLFDPHCVERSHVRIVEQFLTRDVAGRVFGDPDAESAADGSVAANAHRFSVLLPHRFNGDGSRQEGRPTTTDTRRMVERIVELEKPAHTSFEIREYWNMFRVGEARLGLDTGIGHSTYFQPLVLGDSILPNATLGCPYPFNVEDRFVMGRNQVAPRAPAVHMVSRRGKRL